jgi:predicted GIY-YIG superfamily endonuclease
VKLVGEPTETSALVKNTMGYVYILQNEKGNYYIGSTTDVERRFRQHQEGHTPSTKRMSGLKLVFSQKFDTLEEARYIELKLKKSKRHDYIEKIVNDGFIRITRK